MYSSEHNRFSSCEWRFLFKMISLKFLLRGIIPTNISHCPWPEGLQPSTSAWPKVRDQAMENHTEQDRNNDSYKTAGLQIQSSGFFPVLPHKQLPSSDNPHIFRKPRTWKHGPSSPVQNQRQKWRGEQVPGIRQQRSHRSHNQVTSMAATTDRAHSPRCWKLKG